MKLVTAIIKPDRLDAVRDALVSAKITHITVHRVTGRGRQAEEQLFRGEALAPHLLSKVRLDIACNDAAVKTACEAIIKAARHGNGEIGDGKIFITPLEDVIRIRTGESGTAAV